MTSVPPCRSSNRSPGYGRARLWVGISAVGTLVTLAAAALAAGLPTWVDARVGPGLGAALMPLAMYVATHAAVQLPFDFFGGYFLPMWYGRSRLGIRNFLGRCLLHRGDAAGAHLAIRGDEGSGREGGPRRGT